MKANDLLELMLSKEFRDKLKALGLVVQTWRGILYIRFSPKNIKNPQTNLQQNNRNNFGGISRFASIILEHIIHPIWNKVANEESKNRGKKISGYTLFISTNRRCFTPERVEYENLDLTWGNVKRSDNLSITGDPSCYTLSWKNYTSLDYYGNDLVRLVVIDECSQTIFFLYDENSRRKDCSMTLSLPEEKNSKYHFYLFFQGVDRDGNLTDEYSSSMYVRG